MVEDGNWFLLKLKAHKSIRVSDHMCSKNVIKSGMAKIDGVFNIFIFYLIFID
jgi:hypothetical protein